MTPDPNSDDSKKIAFEPKRNRKKTASSEPKSSSKPKTKAATLKESAIPEVVSQRMISRMLVLSGLPTGLGICTFLFSYVIVTKHLFELPNTLVVLVSMACFGLGVLGLSYGVLSASWEQDQPGSFLGWSEFRTNWKRIIGAWRTKKNSS